MGKMQEIVDQFEILRTNPLNSQAQLDVLFEAIKLLSRGMEQHAKEIDVLNRTQNSDSLPIGVYDNTR